MNQTHNQHELCTGKRLQDMRTESNLSIEEAVSAANRILTDAGSDMPLFTVKSMRRFENIGVTESYGTTPPTLAQLHVLMRIYSGSPGYLMLGIPPVRYPLAAFGNNKDVYFSDDMITLMATLASMSETNRTTFFRFIKTFFNVTKIK